MHRNVWWLVHLVGSGHRHRSAPVAVVANQHRWHDEVGGRSGGERQRSEGERSGAACASILMGDRGEPLDGRIDVDAVGRAPTREASTVADEEEAIFAGDVHEGSGRRVALAEIERDGAQPIHGQSRVAVINCVRPPLNWW